MGDKVKLVLGCDANKDEKCAECGRKAPIYLKVACVDTHIADIPPCYPGTAIAINLEDMKFCLPCVERMVEKAKKFEEQEALNDPEDTNVGC